MSQASLSPADLQAAVDAFSLKGSNTEAAALLSLNVNTFKHRYQQAVRHGYKPPLDKEAHLSAKVRRLESELAKATRETISKEIIQRRIIGLRDDVATTPAPEWLFDERARGTAHGVPTLFMSDWHWGEVVKAAQIMGKNQFNVQIAHERVKTLIESAVHLLRILDPQMRYPGIVAPLGGDMVSGNIHDELMATNELNTMPTVLDLFGVLIYVIGYLADTFGRVFVPCVGGNHGRDTKKIWSKDRNQTSFDWLLYNFLAKHFENDKRITFLIPDGPDALYKIYDHRYLLTHGDQFRGGDGMIGALGPILRGDHKKRSRNAQIDLEYDTMIIGHWHQYIHHSRVIVNGSLKGYDEYAYANNFGFEPPVQALWVTHPKYGQTYRMPVYVDKQQHAPVDAGWVSIPK